VQNTVHDRACMPSFAVYGMAGRHYDIRASDSCVQRLFLVYGTALMHADIVFVNGRTPMRYQHSKMTDGI
jgi:hypothetical protein